MSLVTTKSFDGCRRAGSGVVLLMLAHLSVPAVASSQEARDEVRVPTSHANVHMGPATYHEILVLVPEDTVLPVTGRQGDWIEVELDPQLKKLGMKMRWYENEERGWMHESTVEVVEE